MRITSAMFLKFPVYFIIITWSQHVINITKSMYYHVVVSYPCTVSLYLPTPVPHYTQKYQESMLPAENIQQTGLQMGVTSASTERA